MPFASYVGNMWTADCGYITKLIPPIKFAQAKQRVLDELLKHSVEKGRNYHTRLTSNGHTFDFDTSAALRWQLERTSWTGIERYAAEHWLASHPQFLPCEVLSVQDGNRVIGYKQAGRLRHHFWEQGMRLRQYHPTPNTTVADGFGPYFQAPGRLYNYLQLYGSLPPPVGSGHWFYEYFQDNDEKSPIQEKEPQRESIVS